MNVQFDHYITCRAHVAAGAGYGEQFLVPGSPPPAGKHWRYKGLVSLAKGIEVGKVLPHLAAFPFGPVEG